MKRVVNILCFILIITFNTNVLYAIPYTIDDVPTSLKISTLNASDSISTFKINALLYAETNQKDLTIINLDKYIRQTGDFSFLNNDAFNSIRQSDEFIGLANSFLPGFDTLSFIYLYIALIGFFIAFVINFTKNTDRISKILIGGFIGIHALFILDFVFYSTNYQFKFAHTYLMSSVVALLYGPLLYFYFKRITQHYKFKLWDILHLLPTVLFILIMLPFYELPFLEKVKIQLGTSSVYAQKDFLYLVFLPKLFSLIIYGFFIGKLYFSERVKPDERQNSVVKFWKKGVYNMHLIYVMSYIIYGVSISGVIFEPNNFIVHSQIIAMSVMVLYVACMAYIQPKVFSLAVYDEASKLHPKYINSGLTDSLSHDLKQLLIDLLIEEKVYMDNTLNLDKLSNKLATTRHNTSQIINEQFNMNYFELINKFRIDEAILLFKQHKERRLNIIDIAYEVGFNNKVTFNKAFKKETTQTPTEFIESLNF